MAGWGFEGSDVLIDEHLTQAFERRNIDVILKPGQVSFHHGRIFHASGPNSSEHDRVGLAFRYITPDVQQQTASRDYAMMMRGVDRTHHWNHLARPVRNFDPQDIDIRVQVMEDLSEALAQGVDGPIKGG